MKKYPFSIGYIGSKKTLLPQIEFVLRKYSVKGDVFGDLFSGTGIVTYMASRLELYSKIISNDLMYYGYVLAKAILCPRDKEELEIGPLLEEDSGSLKGFIYENYARDRMYFSEDNAEKIDYIRTRINEISDEDSKLVAIASLLYCSDRVANTASVYGSFLKKLKKSAKKDINYEVRDFDRVNIDHVVYNTLAEDIEEKIDVLYLDPPYNNRDYESNYHILETIARYDSPELKGKTGLRLSSKKSKFCRKKTSKKGLTDIIEKNSGCRVIILSYNNNGIIPFPDIVDILNKNRKLDIYRIHYSGFVSRRDRKKKEVFEYLFVSLLNEPKVTFYDIGTETLRELPKTNFRDLNLLDTKMPKRCSFFGCEKQPSFNYKGERAIFCFDYKSEGMINVVNKLCQFDGCMKRPHFNFLFDKSEGMINVVNKLCQFDGCMKRPCFNYQGERGMFCFYHKLEGMINVVNRKCLYEGCQKQPCFNYQGETSGMFCSIHKSEEMIDVVNKSCMKSTMF